MGNIISENSPRLNLSGKKRRKAKSYRSSGSSSSVTPRSSESSSYRYIDGRTFNDNTNYSLPNDDEEIDRLHRQHYLVRYVWQGNFCAPVHRLLRRPGVKVLDVGCGPGTWLLEMALDYPEAHFTGIDISPMYPKEIKPINVDFEEVDLTKGLPFDDETFDFIVMRNMVTAISEDDWRFALKEFERICKPGGFVEIFEFEIPGYHIGPNTKRIIEAVIQIMRTKDIDITLTPRIEEMFLTNTRLVNLEHHVKTIPFGRWGGKVGKLMAEDLFLLTKAVAPIVIPLWGIGESQYQEFTNGLVRELEVEKKAYCKIHTIFAQKYEPYLYI